MRLAISMKNILAILPLSLGLLMTGSITELAAQDPSAPAPRATTIANDHSISVEKLAPDYLSPTLEGSGFLSSGSEACALFKRKNLYYAVFDACCCFCPEGSGAQVHVAAKPLGPYTRLNGHPANFTGTDPETADPLEQELPVGIEEFGLNPSMQARR